MKKIVLFVFLPLCFLIFGAGIYAAFFVKSAESPIIPLEEEKEAEQNGGKTFTDLKLYFINPALDPEMLDCTKVFPVNRRVETTQTPGRLSLTLLLQGPTEEEKQAGYATNINSGVEIQSLNIENGVAKVDFDEILQAGVGGSCKVTSIRSQIVNTLKQFSSVKEVVISINGQTEDILQP